MPNEVKLLPCRECGSECRIETFGGGVHVTPIDLWICSNDERFGGDCPSNLAYFDADTWNHRPTTVVAGERQSVGASANTDQALAVPVEPVSRLDPTGFDPSRLSRAIELAARAHEGQTDKAGEPYILHPLRVMLRLTDFEKRIAAVLHDVVEDTFVSLGDIENAFGEHIADAVDALTRREGESYSAFIERCGANDIARAVKWADLRDNMDLTRLGTVTEADLKRQEKYRAAKNRLTAIAMEARQGGDGETRLHPKDDSAGLQGIAQ